MKTNVLKTYIRAMVEGNLKEAPKKKVAPKKLPPLSLMKKITDALGTLGYEVTGREKNSGALKVWMDKPKKKSLYALEPEGEWDEVLDEPIDTPVTDYMSWAEKASLDPENDPPKSKPPVKRKSPGQVVMRHRKALKAAGLETTVGGDSGQPSIQGSGFEVIVPSDHERGDIGADVYIAVYAGPHASEEEMGIDTGDIYLDDYK